MGDETLAGVVSESEAAALAVEIKPLNSGDRLTENMEVESNEVNHSLDDGKDLAKEKTDAGNDVKEDNDRLDGKGEGEPKAEALDVKAIKEESGEGVVEEKEYEEKVEKDVDANGLKDKTFVECEDQSGEKVEKSGEEKIEEQLGEGSKEGGKEKEIERSEEEKSADEAEENKEVKNADKLEDSEEVKNPEELEESKEEQSADEAEEGQEVKKEEELPNSEGKASKKRSRRKSFGVRRDRKRKERKEAEQDEAAKMEKVTDAKKRKKEEKKEKNEKEIDQTPILVDRPVRERKSVVRLLSIIENDAHKEFKIEKGCGTPLKDIPNVASKLRSKNDDTLKLLHNLLFVQRCKAFEIREHISRFSGFVWHDDEEKKKNKVKEKFDKCTKEKLLEICDVLDIPVTRASIKKEELVSTLIDFLVAPHPTTTVLLAEKASIKGQKRKRSVKQSSSGSAKRSGKSLKKSEDSSKGKNRRPLSDSDNDSEGGDEKEPENEAATENDIPEKSDDEMLEESEDEEKGVSEESEDEIKKLKSKAKMSGKKDSTGNAKKKKVVTVEKPKKESLSRSKVEDGDRRMSSKKIEKGIKKSPTPIKSLGKKGAKGKGKSKDATMKPSDEELRRAICEILKEVDFTTATFIDILKQLAKQFDVDLTSRKSSLKLMVQKELTKLADEGDDDEEDGKGEEEGDTGKVDAVAGGGTEAKA